MKKLALIVIFGTLAHAQNVVGWKASTGDVSLSGAGTTVTIQKPTTPANTQIFLEKIVVYCSVACSVTQAANGSAASATAGTVVPILPDSPSSTIPVNFYTASNVGSGTDQGGVLHIPATNTVVICLAKSCGNSQDVYLGTRDGGTGNNYSVTISSITGTVSITFFGSVRT